MNFAVDAEFAQTPRDKLRDLTAEIDDQKTFVGAVFHGAVGKARRGSTQGSRAPVLRCFRQFISGHVVFRSQGPQNRRGRRGLRCMRYEIYAS